MWRHSIGQHKAEPYAAHAQHYQGIDRRGGDGTAYHRPIGKGFSHSMGEQDRPQAGHQVSEHEKNRKPIVGYQPDVPGILDEAGWRSRGESPVGIDAIVRASKDENRIHMAENVEGQEHAAGDLERSESVHRSRNSAHCEMESAGDLKQEESDNDGLNDRLSIDVPEQLHDDHVVGLSFDEE